MEIIKANDIKILKCYNCGNDKFVTYDAGCLCKHSCSHESRAKALSQAINGFGNKIKIEKNKIYALDDKNPYKKMEIIGGKPLLCKCGHELHYTKIIDKKSLKVSEIKLHFF